MGRLSIWDLETRENEPRDYCRNHYKRALANALDDYGDRVDDDVEHPPYELEAYVCRDCGATLGEDDN